MLHDFYIHTPVACRQMDLPQRMLRQVARLVVEETKKLPSLPYYPKPRSQSNEVCNTHTHLI